MDKSFAVSLPVTIGTPLHTHSAKIVELSDIDAKISIASPFAVGTRLTLVYQNRAIGAYVTWAEVDRIGIRFDNVLTGQFRIALSVAAKRRTLARLAAKPVYSNNFGRRLAA